MKIAKRVLVVVAEMGHNSQREIAGISTWAKEAGWSVDVVESYHFGGSPDFAKWIDFWRPDGLVVDPMFASAALEEKSAATLPLVVWDAAAAAVPHAGCARAMNDSVSVADAAARELLETGFRRFAFVPALDNPVWSRERGAAFAEAITALGRQVSVFSPAPGDVFRRAPMYNAYCCDVAGNVSEDKSRNPGTDRRALRLGFTAWWLDSDIPTGTKVFATPQALEAGFKSHPAGYGGTRFLTPEFLRPGDEFIPILSGKSKSGKEIAAAAVFKFGSDFKGALVVCGTQKGYGPIAHSERQQALYLARSILVALAEGVGTFYAYELRATEADPYYSESHFGIVHRNLAPKPAYGAYAALTDRRPTGSVQTPGPWRDKERKLYFPQWTRPDGTHSGAI